MNAAVDGDRVLVAAGVYNERVDVQQKAIEIPLQVGLGGGVHEGSGLVHHQD